MHTSRIAEITTVILASAFPTIPRLLQWLQGKDGSISRSHSSYRQPSRPLNLGHSTGSNIEAGTPWDGSGSTPAIPTDNYIRLEEQASVETPASVCQLERDRAQKPGPVSCAHPFDPRLQDDTGVKKTVRIETEYCAQDHTGPLHPVAEVR